MAIMKLFDKITLEVLLANIKLFRFVRNTIKKKRKNPTVLGIFAIKYIIKFKVNLGPSLDSQHEETNCRKKKAPALIPFLTQSPHKSLNPARGWTWERVPLTPCSGLFQSCAAPVPGEGTAHGPGPNTCTASSRGLLGKLCSRERTREASH